MANEENELESVINDIVDLIKSSNNKIKVKAIEALLSISDDYNFISFCKKSLKFKQLLTFLLEEIQTTEYQLSLAILVNMSQDSVLCNVLIHHGVPAIMLHILRIEKDEKKKRLAIILLSNLLRYEEGCTSFLSMKKLTDEPSVRAQMIVNQLIEAYLNTHENDVDVYFHVGYILMNLTCHSFGRNIILNDENPVEIFNRLASQLIINTDIFEPRHLPILHIFWHCTQDKQCHPLLIESNMILNLCCLVYPKKGNSQRRLTVDLNSNWIPPPIIIADNEKPVDSFIDIHACGLIASSEARQLIASIFSTLLPLPTARQVCHTIQAYDVFRIWDLTELEDNIKSQIQSFIQWLLLTEEEIEKNCVILK